MKREFSRDTQQRHYWVYTVSVIRSGADTKIKLVLHYLRTVSNYYLGQHLKKLYLFCKLCACCCLRNLSQKK